jgi:hypothetical protein
MNITIKHWSKASTYGSSYYAWSRYYVTDENGDDYGYLYVKRQWDSNPNLRFSLVESIELNGDERVLSAVMEAAADARIDYLGGPHDPSESETIDMGLKLLAVNSKNVGNKKDRAIAEDRRERFCNIAV